jgi:hypothetical protein
MTLKWFWSPTFRPRVSSAGVFVFVVARLKWYKNEGYKNLLLEWTDPRSVDVAIEYDGGHHFFDVPGWGGRGKLEVTQKHDAIKNVWCKDNGVNLLRISYLDDIEAILESYFQIPSLIGVLLSKAS